MKHQAILSYDYHLWANNKFFGHLKELPDEIYSQEIESVFPSIAETLSHIYVTDTIWLGVILEDNFDQVRASGVKAAEATKGKNLEDLEDMFKELSERYKAFFNSEDDFDRPMVLEHPHYGRLETQLSNLVQQVVNHGTYHRGNLTAMIRQLGHPSVPTDYILYLYDKNAKN
ncbi:DinB family protein [Virgibacillus sp. JSM 102003]|uniref:DinB family protein n=1 Tax=Virgibacillus sp. JSM 102003 TaxID=1562108 RepID=UPI0035C25824